ncbi:hypothetical protein HK100_011741 [Physocladia obscura]|uniref:Glycoside hydrolase family 5 domain-containing protein n=1 Tax=Physocladia obscura TaxID=109957 RepID=A0AAD5XDY4_9FUNG|nr:hypothetical protein HK100_011741 [Physocladia obscura]
MVLKPKVAIVVGAVTSALIAVVITVVIVVVRNKAANSSSTSAATVTPTPSAATTGTVLDTFPLSAASTVIVNAQQQPVLLHGLNWPAHLDYMIPEGLQFQSLNVIVSNITALGLNSVRLTYATQMVDEFFGDSVDTLPSRTNRTLDGFVPTNILAQIMLANPWISSTTTTMDIFDRAVNSLAQAGLMVILDNHVSRAMVCCEDNDGNGFFGDTYFNITRWIRGLEFIAGRYSNVSQVVAISLRNELRTQITDWQGAWYTNMANAAVVVHNANPNALVIVSGINYASTLAFLQDDPFNVTTTYPALKKKIVYEVHWFSTAYSNSTDWTNDPTACTTVTALENENAGFVLQSSYSYKAPLLLTEFTVNTDLFTSAPSWDHNFFECVMAWTQPNSIGWLQWVISASYYTNVTKDAGLGLLTTDFSGPSNQEYVNALKNYL